MIGLLNKTLAKVDRSFLTSVYYISSTSQLYDSVAKHLSPFDKKILVWTGKYKNLKDVPDTVVGEVYEKARNKFRIKIANYMIVGICVGCVFAVIYGKDKMKKGESLTKMNLEWHKKIKEESDQGRN